MLYEWPIAHNIKPISRYCPCQCSVSCIWATVMRHTDKSPHTVLRSKCIEDSMSGSLTHAYQYSTIRPYCRASVGHTGSIVPIVTVCVASRPSCRTCSPIRYVCSNLSRHTAECVVPTAHCGQKTSHTHQCVLYFTTMSCASAPSCRKTGLYCNNGGEWATLSRTQAIL
jgi:hypothetical protein